MAIIGLQRRIREVGRIRIGIQADTRNGRKAPKKLDRFRLTSPDRAVIDAVATRYGGTVNQWNNGTSPQWEVITDATELNIALPPDPSDMAWSQFYETWGKGFCAKRCNGEWDTVRDQACDCDPQNRDCKATSRLSVLLPDIAGLGLWRLESHGYYAAVELAGAVELLSQMAGAHAVIPARLRLEQRRVRRLIGGKPETRDFAVPVIDLDVSILGVRAIAMRVDGDQHDGPVTPELPAGFAPIPREQPPEILPVAAQVAEATKPKTTKPRKNAAAPLPATGRPRRTAAQAKEEGCVRCGQPYGTDALMRNPGEGGRFIHAACKDRTIAETSPESDGPPTPPSGDSGGGGLPGGHDATSPAEPPAAAARAAAHPSNLQTGKIHATVGELWPQADAATRRRITLDICACLGTPGLTSRSEIDRELASVLIDALEAIRDGQVEWDDDAGRLVDIATGEIVGFTRGETP